jgi:hypothetical protein
VQDGWPRRASSPLVVPVLVLVLVLVLALVLRGSGDMALWDAREAVTHTHTLSHTLSHTAY